MNNSFFQLLKQNLRFLIDSFVIILIKHNVQPNTVLIVRLDAIGDFILWLEAAKALRIIYPHNIYKITLVGNELWSDLVQEKSIADDTLFINRNKFRKNLIYRYKILKLIRLRGFAIAIHPVFSRRIETGDSVIRVSGATQRIGWEGSLNNAAARDKKRGDSWYTKLFSNSDDQLSEIERNAEFIRRLGFEKFTAKGPDLNLETAPPPEFNIKEFYILFIGASWIGRCWPLNKFQELASRIYEYTGLVGIICGGPEDKLRSELLLLNTSNIPLQNWVGRTTLKELAFVIQAARILISNDTSAVHIGAALGTPTICILGGGHYGQFLPYKMEVNSRKTGIVPSVATHCMDCFGCNWKCIYELSSNGPVPCIEKVNIEEVWRLVKKTLNDPQMGNRKRDKCS